MLTQEQKSAKLRAELTKELLGSPTKKRRNKLQPAIHKKSGKTKFLENVNKKKDPKEPKDPFKMDKCEHPKYRKEKRESSITASKVMGEKK